MKPFLQEVAEDLVAKFGDSLQDCAIIFNNKRPASYLHKHLADIYNKPFWSPSIFTIQEFFKTATPLHIADFYSQFFLLHRLYNKILASENAGHMDMDKFYPVAKTILSDFAQIDIDHVPADKLFKELEDIALIDQQFDFLTEEQHHFLTQFWVSYTEGKHKKQQENFIRMWRRMPFLYQEFHQELAHKKMITMGMLHRQIADQQHAHQDFHRAYKKIIFVGFNALSQTEAKIFKTWQDQEIALFYFDTDSYYLNDPVQEAGLFLRKSMQQYKLNNALDNQRSFLESNNAPTRIYKVQGQSTQAKILNTILEDDYNLLKEDPSYGQTVVVLADESLLLPSLQTIPSDKSLATGGAATAPTALEVNLNVTMGIGYASSTLFGVADLWLSHQNRTHKSVDPQQPTVPYKTVEMFLTHPLIAISAKKRSQILEAFVLEQLVEVPLPRLMRQAGLFAAFFTPMATADDLVMGLHSLLTTLMNHHLEQQSLKKMDADLFAKTIQELNRLHDTLSSYCQETNERLHYTFVSALIQKALSSISFALSGEPLSGLQIMGLLETRNLNFEHVVILGMNDGIIPKSSSSNSFIPDSLRRVFGLPVLENQVAISAYMFYRLIQRASKVSIVYNSLTDESNSGEISRFVKQLEFESALAFTYIDQRTTIQVEQQEFVEIVKTPEVMAILEQYQNGHKKLSASALTTYIANPIDFFYKYVAQIKEPEEVTDLVEANTLGTILHATLEDFYLLVGRQQAWITKETIQEHRSKLPDLIAENFNKECYGDPNKKSPFNGMQQVIVAIIQAYVDIVLDKDQKVAPFQILQMEEHMTVPFTFENHLGQPLTIQMLGIIDRVDRIADGTIRIVDYKTGADALEYKTLEDAFDTDGKKLNKALVQTLFYTYVLEKAKNYSLVEPNLYVIRKMKNKADSQFTSTRKLPNKEDKLTNQKVNLTGEFLAAEKQSFETLLKAKLQEIFNPDIPFRVSSQAANYAYSPYKNLMVK